MQLIIFQSHSLRGEEINTNMKLYSKKTPHLPSGSKSIPIYQTLDFYYRQTLTNEMANERNTKKCATFSVLICKVNRLFSVLITNQTMNALKKKSQYIFYLGVMEGKETTNLCITFSKFQSYREITVLVILKYAEDRNLETTFRKNSVSPNPA